MKGICALVCLAGFLWIVGVLLYLIYACVGCEPIFIVRLVTPAVICSSITGYPAGIWLAENGY